MDIAVTPPRHVVLTLLCLFVVVWAALLTRYLFVVPLNVTYSNDAEGYHAQAVHLLHDGMMSIDGARASTEHEPGYILFLAGVYALFGDGNRIAVFIMQTAIFAASAVLFGSVIKRRFSSGVGIAVTGLLLFLPSTFDFSYRVNREMLALAFFLFSTAFLLRFAVSRRAIDAVFSGVFLGCLALTYFLFAPLAVILPFCAAFLLRFPPSRAALIMMIPILMAGVLVARNARYDGADQCLAPGCVRGAFAWYVRGEQVQALHGLDPLRCLWAEYVTRDFSGLPEECSFGGVLARRWPDGFVGHEADIRRAAAESRVIIMRHPFSALRLWAAAVIEYHLPFFASGKIYNILTTIMTAFLAFGMLASLPLWRRRDIFFFVIPLLYGTAAFAMLDVVPRYRFPVVFSCVMLAVLGWRHLYLRFQR